MSKEFTEFFNYFDFTEPNIVEYHKNKVDIFIRDKSYLIQHIGNPDDGEYSERVVRYAQGEAELFVNGERWLRQYLPTATSVGGVFSHYWFARGHTLTTGLGLGIRENWLLNKEEVTKLTIVEKNLELIEYHKEYNPDLFKYAEVIHADANEYVGKCDVLLMDHYEKETVPQMAEMSSKVSKNINCEVCWFWPIEELVQKHPRYFQHDKVPSTALESYEYIKKKYDLPKLPELNGDTLNLFLYVFNQALS